MTLLHIDSSILGDHSVSRKLTAAIVKRLTDAHIDMPVAYLDLVADPLGHLSMAEAVAFKGNQPSDEAAINQVSLNKKILEDFLAAEVLVIGAPMYNFSVPSQLKAWVDRIVVAGKTFRYTATGPQGLAVGKRVIVASTRGGMYGESTPSASLDHQEKYLRNIFEFVGITDITFVRAEGLAMDPYLSKAAVDAALAQASQITI